MTMDNDKKAFYCRILNRFFIYPHFPVRAISRLADELIIEKEKLRPLLHELANKGFLKMTLPRGDSGAKWMVTDEGIDFYQKNKHLIALI